MSFKITAQSRFFKQTVIHDDDDRWNLNDVMTDEWLSQRDARVRISGEGKAKGQPVHLHNGHSDIEVRN